MKICGIVAMTNNAVIGDKGKVPWNIPEDLKYFKTVTMGHALVLGRKTYESIGRPLPGRKMFVVSRQANLQLPPDVSVCSSVDEGIARAKAWSELNGKEQIFIAGGAEIYSQTIHLIDRYFITVLPWEVEGDTQFPSDMRFHWGIMSQERRRISDGREIIFVIMDRLHGLPVIDGGA